MNFPTKTSGAQELIATNLDELAERLGKSGTLVYMPNCDRLTSKTDRGLVQHAIQEFSRVYRRFIANGVRIYVNNRRVEAFDPTYWMPSARHTAVEGLSVTKSKLIDSWPVMIPVTEDGPPTTEIRVRVFMLPVEAWSALPRDTKNKLQVYEDHTVSFLRNQREVAIGSFRQLKLAKHATNNWLRVEVEFTGDADEGFGVATNKQGVRLKDYVAEAILDRLADLITQVRKQIREAQLKVTAAAQIGHANDAERQATKTDSVQAVSLPTPPVDSPEQLAALEENLRGLAVALRQEGETEEQALLRVKSSRYLTDFKHLEYAPFYDTEYKFGKLILRLNTAHAFYQKVWQPLGDLAKKVVPHAEGVSVDEDGLTKDVAEATRTALTGLQLLFLSLVRAQTQMTMGTNVAEHTQLFRNLRKSWSDVLETQFLHM